MILRGNFDLIGQQILHRMIRAVMAELQLKSLTTEREAAELVAQANAENRHAAGEVADVFLGIGDGLRVAGTIRKENTVRVKGKHILGRSVRGNHGRIAVMIEKQTQDVLLDAVVVGHHFEPLRLRISARLAHLFGPGRSNQFDGAFLPIVSTAASHAASEFLAGHQRQLFGLVDQLVRSGAIGRNDAAQCADLADMQNERARIDVPDDRNLVAIEIKLGGFRGAPVRGNLREFANDQGFNVRTRGLLIVQIGADIANVRIGQANDLPGVAGIGENFLVTGEAGVENDFTAPARDGAGGAAIKYAPVFERECGGSMRNFRQVVLRTASFITGLGR